MRVSVILPTFNEADNIGSLIAAVLANIPQKFEPEIIVVDDNSPDGTASRVTEQFGRDPRIVTISRTTDPGLAKSIRAGVERATGDSLIVMDTDFTHDPAEIPRLLHVGEIYDLVSGSRFCAGGTMQDTKHYLASLLYNWLLRIILRTQVQDNLGGYFVISRKAMFELPFDLIFFGYGDYYFRLLYFLEKNQRRIVEIPAQYRVRTSGVSKSRVFNMIIKYSWGAITLRFASARWGGGEGQRAGSADLPTR